MSSYCTTSTGRRRPIDLDHEVAGEPARGGERRAELRHVLVVVAVGDARFDRFHEYTTARGSRITCATRTSTPGTRPSATGSIGKRDESTTTRAPVTSAIARYTADDAVV